MVSTKKREITTNVDINVDIKNKKHITKNYEKL